MTGSLPPTRAAARPGSGVALIIAALCSALPIWWIVVLPVLNGAAAPAHGEHYASVLAHAVGGTAMLIFGAGALYVGWTRRGMRAHKWIGYAYLIGGALGAGMGLALSVMNPHPLAGVAAATGTLALAWLAVAAMAWRAALNNRFDTHREWMVRSYVLTWTFVFCRIVMRLPQFSDVDGGTIVAIIWASWIAPLIVCEIALQWGRGARAQKNLD
jgi:hypothetical protein